MKRRTITLLGTSGVGKTTLGERLIAGGWYHYSGDYRIATHYMDEAVCDWLERIAAQQPLLSSLLSDDALRIKPHVRIDNLRALSAYIGKLGKDGYDYETFCRRQHQFAVAEKAAMYDFVAFRARAECRYGATAFINDAGGSLCEYIDDEQLMDYLLEHTLPVYIRADAELEAELLDRAMRYPKPICYDPEFLDDMIAGFAQERGIAHANDFPADEFIRYVMPRMMKHRDERAMAIVARGGVVLAAKDVWQVRDSDDFDALLTTAYREQQGLGK